MRGFFLRVLRGRRLEIGPICFRCHPNFFGLIHITKHPKPHDPKRDGKNRVYFSQQIALVTSIFWKGGAGKGRARFARASSAFNFLES